MLTTCGMSIGLTGRTWSRWRRDLSTLTRTSEQRTSSGVMAIRRVDATFVEVECKLTLSADFVVSVFLV